MKSVGGHLPAEAAGRTVADATDARWVVPARIAEVQGVVDGIQRTLTRLRTGAAGHDGLLLAVREGLVNAIRHGCAEDPDQRVRVGLRAAAGGEVTVEIHDPGPGFTPEQVPDPTGPATRWRPHGRGLFLIRHLTDQVRYAFPPDGGTVLTLTLRPANSHSRPNEGDPMPTATRTSNGATIVDVFGDLDAANTPQFNDATANVITGKVVVNLAETKLIDSTGVGALMGINERVLGQSGELYLSGVTGQVLGILKLLNMDKAFKIVDNVDAAV
ncbi:ATP-binding protein [Streptomyces sp. NPDC059985]|uniref:ATP-binding protein n=1 Tax=Streptomyces sp. NPDC059985 TaxID=3347025 RepID=UPI0036BADCBE